MEVTSFGYCAQLPAVHFSYFHCNFFYLILSLQKHFFNVIFLEGCNSSGSSTNSALHDGHENSVPCAMHDGFVNSLLCALHDGHGNSLLNALHYVTHTHCPVMCIA